MGKVSGKMGGGRFIINNLEGLGEDKVHVYI
jgi:hypothetical protein